MSVFTEIEVAGETLPVAVIRGADKGPRVLVTAGIHGCEFVGIEGSSSKTPVPSRMEQKCSVRLFLTTPECAVFLPMQ